MSWLGSSAMTRPFMSEQCLGNGKIDSQAQHIIGGGDEVSFSIGVQMHHLSRELDTFVHSTSNQAGRSMG